VEVWTTVTAAAAAAAAAAAVELGSLPEQALAAVSKEVQMNCRYKVAC
jgi:hypothetical protein